MTTSISTAEAIGRMILEISEFIQPSGGSLALDITATHATAWCHHLDPERWPLHNVDDFSAPVRVLPGRYGRGDGKHVLISEARTPLKALQNAAAYLVFPPQAAESHLRVVGGAS